MPNKLPQWLEEHSAQESLIAIGCDSTNTNTGWEGGVVQYIEEMLGRRLIWLPCMLHTSELPLRAIMEHYIGPTESNTGFSG